MTPSPEDGSTAELLDGRYLLGECVGQGGMARVHRAEDVLLGRTVAIKLMRTDAEVEGRSARVRTEMEMLAALHHPALVTLYDGCLIPGRPEYLVMEFVDGPSLAERLHEGPLPAPEVVRLASDLASALHVVHGAGIVHRDVKPSNVLLGRNPLPGGMPQAKLADFGIASLIDGARLTSPGLVIGTAAYLAPEQVRGEAPATPADVYALGLVLLEALTGARAFAQASGIGAVMARLVESPEIPRWLPAPWAELLSAMTASDPAVRPTALGVLEAVASLPLDVPPPPPPLPAADAAATPTVPFAARTAATVPGTDDEPVGISAPSRRAVRARTRPRSPRRLLVGAAAAALLISGGTVWGMGALGERTAAPETPVVEEPVSEVVAPEPAVVDPAETDTVPVTENAPPAPGTGVSEKAQREAEKAQREAEKAAKDDKPKKDEKPKKDDKGPGPGGGPGERP